MKKKLMMLLIVATTLAMPITAFATEPTEIEAEKEAEVVPATGIQITENLKLSDENDNGTITVTVLPADVTNYSFSINTENEDTVSAEITNESRGTVKVTALKYGTSKITAKSKDGDFTADCNVTVYASDFTLEGTAVNVKEKGQLKAGFKLPGLSNTNIAWKSSDESIVKIDQSGKFEALKNGKATITATLSKSVNTGAANDIVKTCEINVCTPAKEIKLARNTYTIYEGKTCKINQTVLPENTTDKSVTYTSADTKIATVDENGIVTGIANGKTTIKVQTKDGSKIVKEVTVNVLATITGMEAKTTKFEVKAGKTLEIPFTVKSVNTNYTPFLFAESSDESVLDTIKFVKTSNAENTVLKVVGVKEGKATVKVTTIDTFENELEFEITVTKADEEKPVVVEKPVKTTKVMVDGTVFAVTEDKAVLTKADSTDDGIVKVPRYIWVNEEKIEIVEIGAGAFKNCKKITGVKLPTSIEKISDDAFNGCKKLAKIDIPVNVKEIGKKAFYGCSKLKNVTIKSKKVTAIGSGAFTKNAKKATIKVPSAKLKAYTSLLKNKTTSGTKIKK